MHRIVPQRRVLHQGQNGIADQSGRGVVCLGQQTDQVGDQHFGWRGCRGKALADAGEQGALIGLFIQQLDKVAAQLLGGSVGDDQLCRGAER
ncbi:hypothetical protein D9M71_827410 [compost metagenome]